MIRLLLLFYSLAVVFSASRLEDLEENDEKFRTLKTDIQLSPGETQELLDILKGTPIQKNKKQRKLVENEVEKGTVLPVTATNLATEAPILTSSSSIVVQDEDKSTPAFDLENELMESFITTSAPIPNISTTQTPEILPSIGTEPVTVSSSSGKKLKLRKIAVNNKGSHFFKLRSDELKKIKRRLIKEEQRLGDDFEEILSRLKEEQKNGGKSTIKGKKVEKKGLLDGEIATTILPTRPGIFPPIQRKPLPISPITVKEPLHSLVLIRNGRQLSLSRKQQHDIDGFLRTLLPDVDARSGERLQL